MRRLIALLVGVAIGGGVVFGSFQYHLVRTEKNFIFVRRQRADWHDAYVDIRKWSHHEWGAHRDLSNDLIAAGRGDLITRSLTEQFFRGLFESRSSQAPN